MESLHSFKVVVSNWTISYWQKLSEVNYYRGAAWNYRAPYQYFKWGHPSNNLGWPHTISFFPFSQHCERISPTVALSFTVLWRHHPSATASYWIPQLIEHKFFSRPLSKENKRSATVSLYICRLLQGPLYRTRLHLNKVIWFHSTRQPKLMF